jgi:hypothetical protein
MSESLISRQPLLKDDLGEFSNDNKVTLVLPMGSKILTKEEDEKLFNLSEKKDKKREYSKVSPEKNKENLKNKKIKKSSNVSAFINSEPQRKVYMSWSEKKLDDEIEKIESNIKEIKEEEEKSHKTENDITKFNQLYIKWLKISQEAVLKLLDIYPENLKTYQKNTIKNLLDEFKIDYELIKYDEENEDFLES